MNNQTPIIGGVATVPQREATFRQMLASVAPQVDQLHVYLSGFVGFLKGLPLNCTQHKVEVSGDLLGDAGKFMGLLEAYQVEGYYLTFDDDLLYPGDYVEAMIAGIERYGQEVVCSFHGRKFDNLPIKNYYRDATSRYYCLRDVHEDVLVDVLGTGCLGFHTSALELSMEDFPSRNMADVHMAVALVLQDVPAVCLKHAGGWIQHLPIDHAKSIYNQHKDDCREQTRRINEVFG